MRKRVTECAFKLAFIDFKAKVGTQKRFHLKLFRDF